MGKKYVNVRQHPTKNYELRCYNKKAFFDKHWNEDTIHARGHVYDVDNGDLLSMPFPKFFNIDENEFSQMKDVSEYVYENFERIAMIPKYNGHLAILFHDGDEWVNTTKGSFDHDFVALDRLVIEDSGFTDEVLAQIPKEWTLCFEIVADYDPHLLTNTHFHEFYEDSDFAILLGVNDTLTERSVSYSTWEDRIQRAFTSEMVGALHHARPVMLIDMMDEFQSAKEAEDWLNDVKSSRTDCEGYILHDVDTDWRIKLKTDWFVYERYKFQFNAERTRNIFRKFYDTEAAFEKIPEEFHERYRSVLVDYGTFLENIERNMMESLERMHEGGLLMRHELEAFIESNPNLTTSERSVMMAYMSNIGYQGKTFDMFCETYDGFSLVDKLE